MRSEWLDSFLALAATRNFSRAAESRNVTQPAFSRRIHALEEWLGVELFDRSAGGASLNAAGEAFLSYAEGAVRDLRRARSEVLQAAGQGEQPLAFAATHALSFSFFPNWIREHAPHEPLNLVSDSMASCEEMMLRAEVAFLLHHSHQGVETALKPRLFKSLKVGEDVLAPLCRPDADGRPMWPLVGGEGPIPHLAYSSLSALGRILKTDWAQKGYRFNLTTSVTSLLAAALLTMVRDGQGLAWLPRSLVEQELASGSLVDAGDGAFSTRVDITLTRPVSPLDARSERFWKQFL